MNSIYSFEGKTPAIPLPPNPTQKQRKIQPSNGITSNSSIPPIPPKPSKNNEHQNNAQKSNS